MRAPRMNNERGVALAMAIFALVIIGILVAGSFFAGRLEQQSGQNTLFAAQAAEAAEAGLSDALGTYNATTLQPSRDRRQHLVDHGDPGERHQL